MHERDRKRFILALNAAGAMWRVEVTEPMIHGYWLGLEDVPIEAVEAAFAAAMKVKTFMPVPAELRELAGIRVLSLADRAEKAWAAVEGSLAQHAYYHSVDFDDPVINAAIRSLGGWMHLGGIARTEREAFYRRDFIRAYQSLCRAGLGGDQAAPLCGYYQQQNNGKVLSGAALESSTPVRIATGLPALPRIATARRPTLAAITCEIAPDACKMPEEA